VRGVRKLSDGQRVDRPSGRFRWASPRRERFRTPLGSGQTTTPSPTSVGARGPPRWRAGGLGGEGPSVTACEDGDLAGRRRRRCALRPAGSVAVGPRSCCCGHGASTHTRQRRAKTELGGQPDGARSKPRDHQRRRATDLSIAEIQRFRGLVAVATMISRPQAFGSDPLDEVYVRS